MSLSASDGRVEIAFATRVTPLIDNVYTRDEISVSTTELSGAARRDARTVNVSDVTGAAIRDNTTASAESRPMNSRFYYSLR